jgi:hypothetical protein
MTTHPVRAREREARTEGTTGRFAPGRAADGSDVFVVGHADGSVYVCERGKEPCQDPQFAAVKDATLMQFTVSPKAAKHSPTAR